METNTKWVLGILLIAVILLGGAWHYGYLDEWLGVRPPGPGPEEGEEWLGGTYTLTVAGRDSLDSSASLAVGTDFAGDWWAYRSGGWVFLGSGSASGSNIESDVVDYGYIWLLVEEKSTKYFYADVANTISRNTYVLGDYKWVDADGDTDKEFLYKVSLWNIPEPASGYPARTLYPYFMAESGQGTAADALKLNAPADITSVGTSTVTKYIAWEGNLTASKRAVGVHKIEITINSTATTKWELDKVNVPGVGYLDGSLFTEDVRTSDTKYQYIVGNDFDNIVYWKIPSGSQNAFDCTVALKCTFGATENYTVTLYVYQWLYNRVSISDNDGVKLTA